MDERGDDAGDPAVTDRERVERLRQRARERWSATGTDVDGLAAGLASDDAEVRAAAAWSLAEFAADDPDRAARVPVESRLVPLLADDDPWVRRGASWAMAVVADEHPQRARPAFDTVVDGLTDDDPLVRENAVLAVSGVASEYPRAAERALSRLADVVRADDGLARRYAAETLRRLVTRLDEDGFPETVEATPEIAEILSGDAGVVAVTDDEGDGAAVRVRSGGSDRSDDAERSRQADDAGPLGPPDRVPEPPAVEAERGDFERLADLGRGPLTDAEKVRVRTATESGRHVVAVRRTLRTDAGVAPDRVERAVRAWASADDHPHVAPVLARGGRPRPWFATEFMDGGSLRDAVGAVGFERAVWYADCVASAVCHAHARGVVHGALRPGAVGLSQAFGAWSVPKVGDWGFGDLRAAVRTPPVPPAYAAPEQLAPEEFGRPDHATDVYQLGALCYALFAGRPPFVGHGDDAVARAVRTAEPAPPSAHAPDVPEPVDELVGRALTKRKHARFETAEDFRRELELFARDRSLSFEL